jgi:hypothetical protein
VPKTDSSELLGSRKGSRMLRKLLSSRACATAHRSMPWNSVLTPGGPNPCAPQRAFTAICFGLFLLHTLLRCLRTRELLAFQQDGRAPLHPVGQQLIAASRDSTKQKKPRKRKKACGIRGRTSRRVEEPCQAASGHAASSASSTPRQDSRSRTALLHSTLLENTCRASSWSSVAAWRIARALGSERSESLLSTSLPVAPAPLHAPPSHLNEPRPKSKLSRYGK